MRVEILTKKHYEHMWSKYQTLYEAKFPWSVKALTEGMIKDHINRVVATMDEAEYIKEINESTPVNIPQN